MPLDWEGRLRQWATELELAAQLEGVEWVTLGRAEAETGVSRSALRNWYRSNQIRSRLVDGPHGPTRLVVLEEVSARAQLSPRLMRQAEREVSLEAQVALVQSRLDHLEMRLGALERRY